MKKNFDFSNKVLELVKKIPKGKVTTYKEVAHALNTNAYRAVGNALNKNSDPDKVPCFRIVMSNGNIGGFKSGIKEKIKRLEEDGIKVKRNRVDLKKYFYKIK